MRLAGGNGDTEGCRWAVWGSPTLLPHTSHRLSPSEPPCRSACRRRGRKVSPGRTHRRGSPARAPRSHVPSSRQTEPVSGGCLAHKHLPPRRQGKTQLLVRTAKQCLVSDSPAAGKEKKSYLWTSWLFCRVARCTTQAQLFALPSAAKEPRNCLVD